MKKPLVLWLLILAVAAAVRLPALPTALPYSGYIDEGHVLHQVIHLLSRQTWEQTQYYYPSFPFYLIAGAATAYSPLYAARHGHPLREDLSASPPLAYDIMEPADLIVIGRLVTLAVSLAVVVLTGLLARRLAGPAAGFAAAWLAALIPGLVARSAIVTVNPHAALFTVGALFFAEGMREGGRPRRDAVLAGVMTGLAAVCKYQASVICLSVAIAALLASAPWTEKLRRLVIAGAAAAATTVLAMPALVLDTADVATYIKKTSDFYVGMSSPSYWDQAVRRAEWDLPIEAPELGAVVVALAAAGLIVAMRDRRRAKSIAGWLVYGAATCAPLVVYDFQPFRNILMFVPLACVLAALFYAWARERTARSLWVDLVAAALPVVLFAPALHGYIRHQLAQDDSREQAVRWLAGRPGPRDTVLVAEELAFLPSRLADLGAGRVDVQPWERARDRVLNRRYHYLILGDLNRPNGKRKIPPAMTSKILRNYALQTSFGAYPTAPYKDVAKGNSQKIYILKRVPRPDRPDRERVRKPSAPPPREAARRSAAP